MEKKKRAKIAVDILMSILLLFLMAYQVTGELWHEWCGAAMQLLFLIHNIFNRKWYLGIFRGRYFPLRIFMTATNILCLAAMLCLMVSGMMMSRHVFSWLPFEGSMSLARMMHMSASYLGFVFMSLHIGLHWRMVTTAINKILKERPVLGVILRSAAGVISLYGLYVFIQARLWRYMFLQDMFVFMDYEKPAVLVLGENLSMMVMWATVAYYIALFLTKNSRKNK